jgi:hypothetical protein
MAGTVLHHVSTYPLPVFSAIGLSASRWGAAASAKAFTLLALSTSFSVSSHLRGVPSSLLSCRLDRNTKELVAGQAFSSLEVEEFYMEKTPKIVGYIYRGMARK